MQNSNFMFNINLAYITLISTGDETTLECLEKDVAKVEEVASMLGNEACSHIGNSTLEAQGELQYVAVYLRCGNTIVPAQGIKSFSSNENVIQKLSALWSLLTSIYIIIYVCVCINIHIYNRNH